MPLVAVNQQHSHTDAAADAIEQDVIPPRPKVPMKLNRLQTDNLKQSAVPRRACREVA